MRQFRTVVLAAAMSLAASGFALAQNAAAPPGPPPGPANTMVMTSSSFADGGIIPDKYTQAVPNPTSPQLAWTDPPEGTKSFVLLMHDPEGAVQRKTDDILHWLMFNIPATTRSFPEGMTVVAQAPDGTIQAKNQQGKVGFMGPGSRNIYHHYTFELFALDTTLPLGPDASRADIFAAMQGHILGKAVDEARFHR
jgi:hypothetical protein